MNALLDFWGLLLCAVGLHSWGPPWEVREWDGERMRLALVVHCRRCREWAELPVDD